MVGDYIEKRRRGDEAGHVVERMKDGNVVRMAPVNWSRSILERIKYVGGGGLASTGELTL